MNFHHTIFYMILTIFTLSYKWQNQLTKAEVRTMSGVRSCPNYGLSTLFHNNPSFTCVSPPLNPSNLIWYIMMHGNILTFKFLSFRAKVGLFSHGNPTVNMFINAESM